MTAAPHPHSFKPRWGRFVALAFVAFAAGSLLDWPGALRGGVADATSVRGTGDSTTAATATTPTGDTDMDIGQRFYTEKATAPAQELPPQF